jgi:hypothetical protein
MPDPIRPRVRFRRSVWREARLAAPGAVSEAQRLDSNESNQGQQGHDQDSLRVFAHRAPQTGKRDPDHMGWGGAPDRAYANGGRA